ncbi:hypothetical protein WJX72_005519 [[Myrmecia] bisecta]|uniref:Lysosomal Pro-X carboxypeptidase n=1 Tax=[Myrmecia] bisecta TaxID=41462 RepID=A0AAW1PWV8_9CHLO
MRYFFCDQYWKISKDGSAGPIFFYAGNESDVEVYVNATGLMWENAAALGALLIFAEHRYYGKSQPLGPGSIDTEPGYLSAEQALADYAQLIHYLRGSLGAQRCPVIAFGGSYGGMLAAWLRRKYPALVQGAIAASAPVGAFVSNPKFDTSTYWKVVTDDASAAGGASEPCAPNVRRTFAAIFERRASLQGRQQLSEAFHLCEPLAESDVEALAFWLQGAFDAYAMGNYPYPSSYMGGTADHPLPAWPMRVACQHLSQADMQDDGLFEAIQKAVAPMYNASGSKECYKVSELAGPAATPKTWLYLWCTEQMPQEMPYFPANGRNDMFWDQGPFNKSRIEAECLDTFGVAPRYSWAEIEFGLTDYSASSNIVFSNGELDPWHTGGVLHDVSETVVALVIPDAAHHLDLMFSHPDDPPAVVEARKTEVQHIERWVKEHAPKTHAAAVPVM